MRVAYWKDDHAEKQATGRKVRPSYGIGVIINVDNSRMNGNVWVRSDNNIIVEVARENFRSPIGYEHWTPQASDCHAFDKAEK